MFFGRSSWSSRRSLSRSVSGRSQARALPSFAERECDGQVPHEERERAAADDGAAQLGAVAAEKKGHHHRGRDRKVRQPSRGAADVPGGENKPARYAVEFRVHKNCKALIGSKLVDTVLYKMPDVQVYLHVVPASKNNSSPGRRRSCRPMVFFRCILATRATLSRARTSPCSATPPTCCFSSRLPRRCGRSWGFPRPRSGSRSPSRMRRTGPGRRPCSARAMWS
mmetsp:Transcript_12823/g.31228  ORF Transcript_12823/g.31228 Transcript_12823/m.31228 type:complete len:224 (+) Transcript_12823:802-1473(+)